MQIWTKIKNNIDFWQKIAAAPGLLLMLDYDGTLAPFTAERHKAWPYEGVRGALHALLQLPFVKPVIISGRPCAEIEPLLGLDFDIEVWGSHGGERKLPGSHCHRLDIEHGQEDLLESAYEQAVLLVHPSNIERKPFSVAVHVRDLEESHRQAVLNAVRDGWNTLLQHPEADLLPFACGLELRVGGHNKARAVTALVRENPDMAAFYVGDDHTDEDAFAALVPLLKKNGLVGAAVLAAAESNPESSAQWLLSPPYELLEFLALLADVRS